MWFHDLTDMANIVDVVNELQKRYESTILEITDIRDGSTKLWVYGGYTSTDAIFYEKFNGDGDSLRLPLTASEIPYEVTVPRPYKGYYRYAGQVLYFQSSPYRQWKRGLCQGNCTLNYVEQLIHSVLYLGGTGIQNQIKGMFSALLDTESPGLDKAKEALKSVYMRVAKISLDFALIKHTVQKDGFILLFHNCIVGEVTESKIIVKNKAFIQEVIDNRALWPNYEIIGEF